MRSDIIKLRGFKKMREEVGMFKIDGEPCRLIQLTRGFWMIVDAEDYEELSKFKWHAVKNRSGKYYVMRNGEKNLKISVHRFLMHAGEREKVDHKNGNTLDNRKKNLRPATQKDNNCNVGVTAQNTSGWKGVSEWRGQFRSQIRVNGKNRSLGYYKTGYEAHLAYCYAATAWHGEFANFG